MKIIAITLHKRADYTKQVLDALSSCEGIEDYHVIMSIDGYDADVTNEANAFSSCKTKEVLNHEIYGCSLNTYFVLDRAFSKSNYVIHIEDDTVPSVDALRYFEWGFQYLLNREIFSIGGYNREGTIDSSASELNTAEGFICWGWATWKDRWEWVKFNLNHYPNLSWAVRVNHTVNTKKMKHIFPDVSRIQNVGARNGVHVTEEEHADIHHIKHWMGDREPYFGDYLLKSGH